MADQEQDGAIDSVSINDVSKGDSCDVAKNEMKIDEEVISSKDANVKAAAATDDDTKMQGTSETQPVIDSKDGEDKIADEIVKESNETISKDQNAPQTTAKNMKSHSGIEFHKVSTSGRLSELKRFTLWETRTHFYLVAYNTSQTLFRILKIDRLPGSQSTNSTGQDGKNSGTNQNESDTSTKDGIANTNNSKPEEITSENDNQQSSTYWSLNVTADRVVYTRTQISEMLDMISEGNKSTGGIKEIGRFFGIVGFIRFTSTYYMVLISRRSVVGLLGGHYIYHCDETKIIPVCPPGILANLVGRTKALDQEEARLLHMFKQVDLSKNFYFSYTYDLTKTLQDNLTKIEKKPKDENDSEKNFSHTAWGYDEKFVWNHHLLMPAFSDTVHNVDSHSASEWVLPLVYGFVDQAKLRVLNCTIHVTLIARRSRHFAGARFLKRGTDEKGHVANDVETEQIVSDALTTPFYAPSNRRGDGMRGPNPRYTSYVMHRGSIPIFWTQDSTNMSPRPPIEINVVDPFYSSAALHFDDMLRRYGYPIIVLNLIKSKEKQPREVKLLNAFGECIRYLNQFLPQDKRLRYIAWDMSRASKSRDQDVIGVLEDIAEETINATKFFHSGPEPNKFCYGNGERGEVRKSILLQSGVARVNCVDCLDRTNAAQFVIGKAALGHQLYALGLLDHPNLPFDSDAIDMLTEMYHDLGDTIALQYGGSHLVNTMETYRKINQWSSHSRDMLEGLKRYYSNSFVDAEKQAAINLFLGVDNEAPDFKHINSTNRRHYQKWYTPAHLESKELVEERQDRLQYNVEAASNFWAEYYRPSLFTDLMRHHAFKMTAIHQQVSVLQQSLPLSSSQHPPSSPTPTNRSSISISSPAKSMSSPASRTRRLRYDSSNLSSYHQSQTIISPFTSRIPLPSSLTGSSTHIANSPTSPKGSITNQGAIIGGVRKWISLNRGEDESVGVNGSSQTTSRKVSSKKLTDINTTTTKNEEKEEFEKQEIPAGMGSILSSSSAWPTWDEITGANVAAPTTGALLTNLMKPEVSIEEVKEYTSWLDQFRDVTFDAGPHENSLEPAALLQSMQNESITATDKSGGGIVFGSMAPAGLVLPSQLHNIGQRKPATQKQRQQIAEADARLYDRDVALAAGRISMAMLDDDGMNTSKMNAIPIPSTLGDISGALQMMTEDDRRNQSIEPALLHYPLTKNPLGAPASEAKLRAYTHWLTGHNTSLPISIGPTPSH